MTSGKGRSGLRSLLMVVPEPPPYYGAAVATARLLDAGRQGQFRFRHIDIIDRAGTGNMGRLVPSNFILAAKHYALMVWQLASHKNIEAVYVLLAFTNAPAFWRDVGFLMIARLFGKSFIVHCHDSLVEDFHQSHAWPTQRAVNWCLTAARSVVVLCPGIGAATQRVAPGARVDIVANGLDLEAARQDSAPGRATDSAPLVLFLSQLSREKGFITALQVAGRLQKRQVAVRFEFAGGWKSPVDEADARRWIVEHGLEKIVRIHGPVTEHQKTQLLQGADALLFPTQLRHEGQPLVILEAMAAGLPVVTTDIGCIRDTVVDGITGFVVRPGDTDELVDKLALLLGDASARRAMGVAARARYLLNYTNEKFIQRMMSVFRDNVPSVLSEYGNAHAAQARPELA